MKQQFVYVIDHHLGVYKTSEALFRENCAPLYINWEELVPGELWRGTYTAGEAKPQPWHLTVTVRRRRIRT